MDPSLATENGTFLELASIIGAKSARTEYDAMSRDGACSAHDRNGSTGPLKHSNFLPRPYAVPIYDPENSIHVPHHVEGVFEDVGVHGVHKQQHVRGLSKHHPNTKSTRLPFNDQDSARISWGMGNTHAVAQSRISLTPASVFRGIEQAQKPLEVPGQRKTDTGFWVWAHAVAGFLIVMSAQ